MSGPSPDETFAQEFDDFIHADTIPDPGSLTPGELIRRLDSIERAYERVDRAVDLVRVTQARQETAIQELRLSVDSATALLHSIKGAIASEVAHNNMIRDTIRERKA